MVSPVQITFSAVKKRILKLQNLLCIIVIAIHLVFTITASLISYQRASDYVNEKVAYININDLHQNVISLQSNIKQIKNIAKYIANEKMVKDTMSDYDTKTAAIKSTSVNELLERLQFLRSLNPYITNITVFSNDFGISTSQAVSYDLTSVLFDDVLATKLKEYLDLTETGIVYFENHTNDFFGNQKIDRIFKDILVYGLPIFDETHVLGCVFIFINKSIITALAENNMTVYDENGTILFDEVNNTNNFPLLLHFNEKSRITHQGALVHELNKDMLFEYELDFNSWSMVFKQEEAAVKNRMKPVRNFYFGAFSIMLIITILISKKFSQTIVRPIHELIDISQNYSTLPKSVNKRKQKRYIFSLQELILTYFFIIIMIPTTLFNMLSFINTSNIIKNYIAEAGRSSFDQTSNMLNIYINQKHNLARNIIYNTRTQLLLDDPQSNDDMVFYDIINTNMRFFESNDEIRLFDINGKMIHSNTTPFYKYDISEDALGKLRKSTLMFNWSGGGKNQYEKDVVELFVRVKSFPVLNNIGYISIMISERELYDIYKGLSSNLIYIVIKDKNNIIISSQNKNEINNVFDPQSLIEERKNSFIFSNKLDITDWTIEGIYDESVFSNDMRNLQLEKIYMTIIMLLLSSILSLFLSHNLGSPMIKIKSKLNQTGLDNTGISFPTDSMISEINDLGSSFNEMTVRIEQLVDDLVIETKKRSKLEITKKNAEITALQSQINPHFLYNTFESLNWIIKHDYKDDAIKMVSDLSELLRYSAKFSEALVSFSDEIKCLKSYADIMSIRFNDNLTFIWEIEPGLMENKTLRFILQPILENAIYHGIMCGGKKGEIKIDGSVIDRNIVFKITDNGVGIEKNKLIQLTESLKKNDGDHIGLNNVQTRLNLFFGEGYGIDIESDGESYTRVVVNLPVIE